MRFLSDRSLEVFAGVAAIATILLSVALLFVLPSSADLANGWKTPIIAFELARTEVDLAFLAGGQGAALRDAMDAGNRIDFFFPFAYGGLLALLLLRHALRGCGAAWLGLMAALVTIPADVTENIVLLRITDALGAATSTTELLGLLTLATWAKWGAIGVAMGALFVPERGDSPPVGVLMLAVAMTTAAAATSPPNAPLGEGMALVVTLAFLVLALRSVWRLFRPLPEDRCQTCA